MRPLRLIAAAGWLAAGLPAAAATPPLDTGKIEAIVTAALKENNIPGAALVIDTPGSRWVQTFGYSDYAKQRPVSRRDYFAIRSITKSFVVTAVLQLIAASHGAITLDDTIGQYLPNIPNGDQITLRELGNMTSGLYNYTADPGFHKALAKNPLRHWTAAQLLAFAFDSKYHGPIDFPPGAHYEYSNTNTLLLGELVEKLTGKKFAATLNAAILKPTGLGAMTYLTGVSLPNPHALGYQGFFDNRPEAVDINATSLNFAGAMASTISDLATWGEVLVGGELLPAKLQAQRFRAHATKGDPNSPLYDKYGLGMGEIAGWWGHTGSGLGYEAAVFHSAEKAETFAIEVNATNSHDVPALIFCRVLHAIHPNEILPAKSVCDTLS
jgi:D-alanyl-D-alanine carboxypeptidase